MHKCGAREKNRQPARLRGGEVEEEDSCGFGQRCLCLFGEAAASGQALLRRAHDVGQRQVRAFCHFWATRERWAQMYFIAVTAALLLAGVWFLAPYLTRSVATAPVRAQQTAPVASPAKAPPSLPPALKQKEESSEDEAAPAPPPFTETAQFDPSALLQQLAECSGPWGEGHSLCIF